MLTEHVHLTSGNTLPEVTTRENLRFGKLFMAKTLKQLCLQPLGWMAARKANDSRPETLGRSLP